MRLRLIWITWWNNKLLFFFPIVVFYLIVPLLTIATALTQNIEESRKIFIFMQQTFGPISSYFWLIAYLNVWLDEDGEECIRCSQFKKPSAAGEALLILILFALMTFPIFLGANLYYQEGFLEYIRLMSTTSFLISCLYFLSVLVRSLTIATMLVFSYTLFSITYAMDGAIQHLCLLKPNIAASVTQIFPLYTTLLVSSSLLIIVGMLLERRLMGSRLKML